MIETVDKYLDKTEEGLGNPSSYRAFGSLKKKLLVVPSKNYNYNYNSTFRRIITNYIHISRTATDIYKARSTRLLSAKLNSLSLVDILTTTSVMAPSI